MSSGNEQSEATADTLDTLNTLRDRFQGMGLGSDTGTCKRNKTWDERSTDEKLEVLREALRSKDMAIQDLREQVSRLMSHSHGRNGELVGPIYPYGGIGPASCHHFDPLA